MTNKKNKSNRSSLTHKVCAHLPIHIHVQRDHYSMCFFTAEIVAEITEAASELDSSSFTIEQSPSDIEEDDKVSIFLAKQCCNTHCHTQFSREEISEHRDMCAQLTKTELDMVIMGKMSVLCIGISKLVVRRSQCMTESRYALYFLTTTRLSVGIHSISCMGYLLVASRT